MIVTWLISRLETGEGKLDLHPLYERYKFECTEASLGDAAPMRVFIETLLRIFPGIKRSLHNKTRKIVYNNVVLNDETFIYKNQHFDQIKEFINGENVVVTKCTESQVSCFLFTGLMSNFSEIMKEIVFNSDGTWSLQVASSVIDLEEFGIHNTYEISKRGVGIVCEIVRKAGLCCGVVVTKDVIVSRHHLLERIQSRPGEGDLNRKALRSLNCKRILHFNQVKETCFICQKMTFRNQTRKHENEPSPKVPKTTDSESKRGNAENAS